MILRDYVCSRCGEVAEDVWPDNPNIKCPKCSTKMSKVFGAPAVVFKGDGWTPKFNGGNIEKG